MSLDETRVKTLWEAMQGYDFPCVTFDFRQGRETVHNSMKEVEAEIHSALLAQNPDSVRDGLTNVLYWGYARTAFRSRRIRRFQERVTATDLRNASALFHRIHGSGVIEIAQLRLPEFRGMSFVSKVRMFLDPENYVILDLQLLKLRKQQQRTVFHEVVATGDTTSIRVTRHNAQVYESWSEQCRQIAARYFPGSDVRAVDVERGIFHLIGLGQEPVAAHILANA